MQYKRKYLSEIDEIFPKKYKYNCDIDDDDLSDDDLHIDLDFNKNGNGVTRPLDFDCVSVTLSSGRRCYVKSREDDNIEEVVKAMHRTETASAEYYRLLDEVESNKFQLAERKSSPAVDTDIILEQDGELWVKKYSPKKYGDLLSNEAVNRGLLTWIKLWDKFVFKKETSLSLCNIENDEAFQVNEKDGRPLKRAVLLSGPPGIGKTTLAVILASHCGYTVIEMNASNDRNPEQFMQKIEVMNTSIDRTGNELKMKPSCLIIDEIDGTSSAAINILINALNASDKDVNKKQGKGKNKLSMMTPVICICNDLYAPSLKNLRSLCYLIRVDKPDYSQMLFRISDICAMEGVNCDRSILSHLIESSNRDIRSCLNTLQFLKQKGNKEITIKDLECLNIGNKDVQKGIFHVWEEIFTSTTLKSSFIQSEGKGMRKSSQRCQNILKLTNSVGDLDRVINGIHENYLSLVRFKDVNLKEMIDSTEWMVFSDLTSQKIATNQSYELMRYKQYIIPFFHLSFASSTLIDKRIAWPTSDVNSHFTKQNMTLIFQTFMSNQTKINAWFHDKLDVIKTVLPYLSHIIRPHQLRPINTQLYTITDKGVLQSTIANMVGTGLEYVQKRLGDLQFQYVLQPNIDALVEFELSATHSKPLTYACKQLIANEIKSEKIKKSVVLVLPEIQSTQNRMTTILEREKAMTTGSTILNTKKYSTNFSFQIEKKYKNGSSNKEINKITSLLNETMLFRFREGCTNAIRRIVKLKDL